MARIEPPEINAKLAAVEERRNSVTYRQRNAESPSKEISCTTGEHANRRLRSGYGAGNFHHSSVASEREDRVIVRASLDCELRRMPRPFGEHDITNDRTARQRLSCMLGEPFSLARCRICDDDRASNQKRHTCDSEKLKFGGGETKPTMLCPPEQVRFAVAGS